MSSNGGSNRRGTVSGPPPAAAAATFRGARMHGATVPQHEVNGHAPDAGSNAVANGVAHAANGATVAAREAVDPTHQAQAHARSVILGGAAALQRLAASVDPTFDRAVGMIEGRAAGSRVLVVGIGKSGHLARKIAATLSSTGTASFFMHGTEALHGDLGGAQAGDVTILISNSGETDEILQAAAALRRARA